MNTRIPFASGSAMAASITRAASTQTYYTIRLLADRGRVDDAFRAYAYFRWVDDELDADTGPNAASGEFILRQRLLLESCYRGQPAEAVDPHEELLVELVQHAGARNDGLQIYLRNMMVVMAFDAARRGRLISQAELHEYTWHLASAVTEALHYFIGHNCCSPQNETRYLAVSAAHITHMLRDTLGDLKSGYYNVPREVLDAAHITPADVTSEAYRAWVEERVRLAREHFAAGRRYLRRVQNPRCRLGCSAYVNRFTHILDLIEQDGYRLRPSYPEVSGMAALLLAGGAIFSGLVDRHRDYLDPATAPSRERSLRGQ